MADHDHVLGEMSFLEHLDELRVRIIRSAIAIGIAFVVCWFVSDRIYNILSVPVTEALHRAKAAQQANLGDAPGVDLTALAPGAQLLYTFPAPVQLGGVDVPAGTTVPARIEQAETGARALVIAQDWAIGGRVFPVGTPLPEALAAGSGYVDPDDKLVIETVQGAFNLYIKVSFYAAIALAVPYLLLQIWGFISPGLYKHERAYVFPFVLLSSLCFAAGITFAYYIAFPAACDYLIGLGEENFRTLINAAETFDLILFIMLGLGLVFQIPTITYFLARLGLVTAGTLARIWRYALVAIFIVAAVLSPTADIPNLLVFALPMILLYTLSIGIAWFFHRRRRTQEEVELEEAAEG